MGGSAKSSSSSATTNSTKTVTDSYNETYNRVNNLSDVGNVKVDLGGAQDSASGGKGAMIAVGIGILIFAAITIFKK